MAVWIGLPETPALEDFKFEPNDVDLKFFWGHV